MKSITPVVSIVLLITMTLVAAGSAFFFINSNIAGLQSNENIDTYPGMTNSRVNLVSVTGSKAIIRNDGTSPVTDLVVFINGELFDYELSEPIMPGEYLEIPYDSKKDGEDLEVKILYGSGQTVQKTSPAILNTPSSGFCSNICGDGVCCRSYGESLSTCVSDCIIKTYLQYENFALYEHKLITSGDKRVFGNRTLFYSSTSLSEGKTGFIDENTAIYVFEDDPFETNIYSYLYYSIYDNGEWSSINSLTPADNTWTTVLDMSQPDIRGVVDFIYQRCTDSMGDCTLFARSWSKNNGFSEPVQLSELVYENWLPHDGVKIASSSNGDYKVAAWIISTDQPINYTIYKNGAWSNVQTINLPSPADNGLNTISVNDKGEIAIAFYKSSLNPDTYHMLFYNTTWWEINITTLGYFFGVSSISNDFILSVSDNFSLLSNYNSSTFDGQEFTTLTPKTIKDSNLFGGDLKSSYNELMSIFISTNGYYGVFLNKTDDSWDYAFDFTLLSGTCEEYEKNSAQCLSETWCSDGVDNDEDGLYDSADTIDCP